MGVASPLDRMKPDTDGEATGKSNHRAARGDWEQRVRKDGAGT